MEGFNDSGFFFFMATLLIMTVSPFLMLYLGEWLASTSPEEQRRHRIGARAILIGISLTPLLISVATAQAWDNEPFILVTETGYEYDIVDLGIVQPEMGFSGTPSAMALRFFGSSSNTTLPFKRARIFDVSIAFNPGFQTSFTNRYITNTGRIDLNRVILDFKKREMPTERKALAYRSIKEHSNSLPRADQDLPFTYIPHSMTLSKSRPGPAVLSHIIDSVQRPMLHEFGQVKTLSRRQTLTPSLPWNRGYRPFSILLDVHQLFGA